MKQTPLPESAAVTNNCVYYGILTLSLQQNNIQIGGTVNRGVAASAPRGPGRPPLNEMPATAENGPNAVNAMVICF